MSNNCWTFSEQCRSRWVQELLAFEQAPGRGAGIEDWQKQEWKTNGSQILLQLARWKATTGQGAKPDVTGWLTEAQQTVSSI